MMLPTSFPRLRPVALLVASALAASLFVAVPAAHADTAPPAATPATASTDMLATPQIDGVVWSQAIVGNTVFAGGNFQTARPPGAAAGTNTVARTHLLSYDIVTGALNTGFAPVIDGQVRGVAASPDGKRLYVVGEFTKVDGQIRSRVAAFDTATGALIAGFKPIANTRVNAVVATGSKVYLGGWFTAMSGQPRPYAAAVDATTGAVLPFAPQIAGGTVSSLVVSPDAAKVVLGGSFTSVNGSTDRGYGLAAVEATSAELLPWAVGAAVRNGGAQASITSLTSDADSVYGTGYVFGQGGNLEGAFRASWADGSVRWVEDCHGDSYSIAAVKEAVYVAGHAHYCGNIGGFPQTEPWTFQRAMAFTKDATQTITPDTHGYYNWAGTPAPSILDWWPDLINGSFTGQGQAAWSVAADDRYVVLAGEFIAVNGTRQQGLTRFAVKSIAPNKDGPRLSGSRYVPDGVSLTAGTARISWPANYDRDNASLTYELLRDGSTTPVYTTTAVSHIWYDRPRMGFLDTGLVPGSTHTYRVRVTDPLGNVALGGIVTITVSSAASTGDYAQGVLADSPTSFWRLGETGATAYDWAGWDDATASGVTGGAAGAILGDTDPASSFDGTSSLVASSTAQTAPDTFAVEAWFSTTSTTGGKIVGFGDARTGTSSNYDRHVYLDETGRVNFGVYPGGIRTVSSAAGYNDGQWHHVVANLSASGMQLYVDGKRVAQRSDTTSAQPYRGYWRIGGDSTWQGAPYFAGTIDDVAVYDAPLNAQAVNRHFTLSGRQSAIPVAPADAYGARIYDDSPDLFWRLGETAGSVAKDSGIAGRDGVYSGGVARGVSSAVTGSASAADFDGADGLVVTATPMDGPQVYSIELWFESTTTRGGKLIGFGSNATGTSGSYDRHVYLQDDGRLVFGTYTGQLNTVTSPKSYTDGRWHHVVATQSSAGLRLYVDGELAGSHAATRAQEYTGYWRVGGDTTWGSSSAYVDARIDEVAVYSRALSQSVARAHQQLGAGAVNSAPTASFATSTTELTVSLNASGSTDADGSIASWAWDFGDGTTGTGVSPVHTYAASGTYPVILTVTDDDGLKDTATKQITVIAPNVAPVASFTDTVSGLTAAVDASASTDDDGRITSYGWDFGDGRTATGVTASNTYATSGTYRVTLTVTDDRGGATTASRSVTVTAPVAPPATPTGVLAEDSFGRSATGSLGTADIGGAWSVSSPASSYSVSGGAASLTTQTAGVTLMGVLRSVSTTDAEVRVTTALTKPATGAGVYASAVGRRIGSAQYLGRIKVNANGSVVAQLLQGGTTLSQATVPGVVYTAGDRLRLRVQVTGTSPTTLRAKVWRAGAAEPTAWQVTATDSTAALQAPGSVGISSYLSGSATNVPFATTFDDFWAGASTTGPVPTTPGDPAPVDPAPVDPAPVDPAPNVAPTATISAEASGLSVAFSGAASSDSDGTIVSYTWDFGDGTASTLARPTHAYAAAGTYRAALTVRDDDGAVGTAAATVTVTAPPVAGLAADEFSRTASSSWGPAQNGGAWAVSGTPTMYSVTAGQGLHRVPAGQTANSRLGIAATATDSTVTFGLDTVANGGGTMVSVVGRRVGSVDYSARVKVAATGTVSVQTLAGTTVLRSTTVAGLTYTAGDRLRVRLEVSGTSPTTVRAKVWRAGTAEPTAWLLSSTDGTAGLQSAGAVGVSSYLSGSATNGPVTVSFDDYAVVTP